MPISDISDSSDEDMRNDTGKALACPPKGAGAASGSAGSGGGAASTSASDERLRQ